MVNTGSGVSRLTTSFIVPAPASRAEIRREISPPRLVLINGSAKFGCFLGQWPYR